MPLDFAIDWQRDWWKLLIFAICITGTLFSVTRPDPRLKPPPSRDPRQLIMTWRSLSGDQTMTAPLDIGPQEDPKSGAKDMYVCVDYHSPTGKKYPIFLQYHIWKDRLCIWKCRFKDGDWKLMYDPETGETNPRCPETDKLMMPGRAR